VQVITLAFPRGLKGIEPVLFSFILLSQRNIVLQDGKLESRFTVIAPGFLQSLIAVLPLPQFLFVASPPCFQIESTTEMTQAGSGIQDPVDANRFVLH
jgi:hypothetical protein